MDYNWIFFIHQSWIFLIHGLELDILNSWMRIKEFMDQSWIFLIHGSELDILNSWIRVGYSLFIRVGYS